MTAHPAQLLRILMVTPRFAPESGGVETHTLEVGRRLVAAGHQVTVLTSDISGNLQRDETLHGIQIVRVRAWPARSDVRMAPGMVRHILRNRGRWDIIHLQGYHTFVAPFGMLAAKLARIPYVVTFHSGGHSSARRHAIRSAQRRMLRPLMRRASKLIAVSQFEARLFQDELDVADERIVVIPNGAQLPQLAEPVTRTTPESGPLIVSVGRLERYKGHQHIIAAMPWVLQLYPDARLRIAGAGPYAQQLHHMIGTLGLKDAVEVGLVAPEDRSGMAGLLARSALFMLFSEYEAHPIAVMEALAMGTPALVAHTSGLGEIADKGWARSIPLTSTPREIADAMIKSLEHPFVAADIEWPTWEECTARNLAAYREVLGQPA